MNPHIIIIHGKSNEVTQLNTVSEYIIMGGKAGALLTSAVVCGGKMTGYYKTFAYCQLHAAAGKVGEVHTMSKHGMPGNWGKSVTYTRAHVRGSTK